ATSIYTAMGGPTPPPTGAASPAFRCPKSGFSSRGPGRRHGGGALVEHEIEARAVGGGLRLSLRFAPRGAIEIREARIAGVVAADFRDHHGVGNRQRGRVQLAAADDEGHGLARAPRDRRGPRRGGTGA